MESIPNEDRSISLEKSLDVSDKTGNGFKNLTEAEIWKNYSNGDEEAYIYLYSKYIDILFNYGRQITDKQEIIKDCIQDLFIFLKTKKNLNEVKSVKAYLYKSLRREIIRALKKESRFNFKDILEKHENFQITLSWEHHIVTEQLNQDRKNALQKSFAQLSVKQREAILYYYYEGFTYREIADIMKMRSVKSARKLIYRSIDALKDSLKGKEFLLYFLSI